MEAKRAVSEHREQTEKDAPEAEAGEFFHACSISHTGFGTIALRLRMQSDKDVDVPDARAL